MLWGSKWSHIRIFKWKQLTYKYVRSHPIFKADFSSEHLGNIVEGINCVHGGVNRHGWMETISIIPIYFIQVIDSWSSQGHETTFQRHVITVHAQYFHFRWFWYRWCWRQIKYFHGTGNTANTEWQFSSILHLVSEVNFSIIHNPYIRNSNQTAANHIIFQYLWLNSDLKMHSWQSFWSFQF